MRKEGTLEPSEACIAGVSGVDRGLTLGCMLNRSIVREVSILCSRSMMGGALKVEIGAVLFDARPGDCVTLVAADVAELRVLSIRLLKEESLHKLVRLGKVATYTD